MAPRGGNATIVATRACSNTCGTSYAMALAASCAGLTTLCRRCGSFCLRAGSARACAGTSLAILGAGVSLTGSIVDRTGTDRTSIRGVVRGLGSTCGGLIVFFPIGGVDLSLTRKSGNARLGPKFMECDRDSVGNTSIRLTTALSPTRDANTAIR